ncbi:MAG: ATP-binding protein, partial [Planctomycetota bacterium]
AAAEQAARSRLQAAAGESARALVVAVERLRRSARTEEAGTALFRDGVFVTPKEPAAPGRLKLVRGRDPMGEWLLARAGQAEFEPEDNEDAAGLYRAAAAPENADEVRKLAAYRWASHLRGRGSEEAAKEASGRFLELLTDEERGTLLEGLIARAHADPVDPELAGDLLACVGGPDEVIAIGLLGQAGLLREDALAKRRTEVEFLRRLLGLVPAGPTDQGGRVELEQGWILVREPMPDGAYRFAAGPAPEVGPDEFVLERGMLPPQDPGVLTEAISVGDFLPGVRVVALADREEVENEAERRSRLMLGGSVLLLLGLGLAIFWMHRAARRETAAAEARSSFVARVGHDLRTPLTLIRMYAETLASGKVKDPEEAREFAGIAAREAERLSRLVDTVLDLSRTSAPPGNRRAVDLRALIQDVADAHRALFQEAGMTIELDLPEGELEVRADPDGLKGVFGNLLENGLRHAAAGMVSLRVEREPGGLRVLVSDAGPGLPAGMEERIFERFVRGPSPSRRGTGLGLALVREVIEQHGGTVRAYNRDGGGACFELLLPATKETTTRELA